MFKDDALFRQLPDELKNEISKRYCSAENLYDEMKHSDITGFKNIAFHTPENLRSKFFNRALERLLNCKPGNGTLVT